MGAREILEMGAENTGWNMDSMLYIVCEYVDNQKDNNSFQDFVDRAVDEEMNEY